MVWTCPNSATFACNIYFFFRILWLCCPPSNKLFFIDSKIIILLVKILNICVVEILGSKIKTGGTVFPRKSARGAHLKVGIRGEALIRGGAHSRGGGAHLKISVSPWNSMQQSGGITFIKPIGHPGRMRCCRSRRIIAKKSWVMTSMP